jgi:hypothetical protein
VAAYTRRRFTNLLQAGAAMAAAGFRPHCLEGMSPTADTGPEFNSGHFARLIGSEFRVASHFGDHLSLILIGVEDLPLRRPDATASSRKVDCALLRFSLGGAGGGAGGGSGLSEGIYRLVHERCGDYDLYVSPGKPGCYLTYLCR